MSGSSGTGQRTIAVVTAGLGRPSSTRLLADRLAEATDRALRLRGEPTLVEAVRTVTDADGLIAVTPVFRASYSGLFKSFFDVLDDGTLAGKPVMVAATAGTSRHSLVLEFALRPLFAHLRAVVVPTAVLGASEDFGSTASGSLAERVDRAGRELADLVVGAPTTGRSTRSTTPRRSSGCSPAAAEPGGG